MTPISVEQAKSLAKPLRRDLAAADIDIPHSLAAGTRCAPTREPGGPL